MRRGRSSCLVLSCVAVASLVAACSSSDAGSGGSADASTSSAAPASSSSPSGAAATPSGPPPAAGRVVFSDEMDDDRNGWGVGSGSTFAGGDYVLAGNAPIGLTGFPDALTQPPAAAVVTARFTAPVGSAFVSVTCNNHGDGRGGGTFYALGVGTDAMAISRTSSDAETPLEKGVLARSDTGVDLTTPHDVQAVCIPGDGREELWLSVDGTVVLSAVDTDPLEAGGPGLQMVADAGTPRGTPIEVRTSAFTVAEAG